jgi:hypothetical protein
LALTKYLVKTKGLSVDEARSKALASIYGKPKLEGLIYDLNSEIYFGKITTQNNNFTKDISFYMPKERAYDFYKNKDSANIKFIHHGDNDDITFSEIELNYKGIDYPLKVIDKPTYTIKIGGYFIGTQNTDFKATKNGIGGVVNLQDLLGMEQKTNTFRFDAIYRLNAKHKFYFSYYDIKNSNTKIVSKDFTFDGEEINAGAKVSSNFDTTIYKFVYEYSAYKTNKLDLLFRVGVHTTTIDMGLNAEVTLNDNSKSYMADNINVTAPLPVLGLGLEYEINKSFSLNYTVDYFYLSFSEISGSMTDTVLALDYKYNKYVGLGFGINATKIRVEAEDEETKLKLNHDVAGFIGYMIFAY